MIIDNSRFTTLVLDPTVLAETKFHCPYCGNLLVTLNRKFAVLSSGAEPFGNEVPLNIFSFTIICKKCNPHHFFIIYLNGKGAGL